MSKIAVFSTSDIMQCYANNEGRKVAEHDGRAFYTRGTLEKALEEGYEVWVISTLTALDPSAHGWWQKLVAPDHVLLAQDGPSRGAESPGLLAPWKEFFRIHGLPWDEEKYVSWLMARDALIADPAFKLGYEFRSL